MSVKIGVKNGRLNLGNLFGTDDVLNDLANQSLNENFLLFAEQLFPLVDKIFSKLFKKLANKIILSRFTEQQLFP